MTDHPIHHILCAVRGAPESRAAVNRAIEIALKHDASLTFLYVIDAEFLEHATVGPLSVVYRELRQMGEFSMAILEERAKRMGVSKTSAVVREGNVLKQLRGYLRETNADILVIGMPMRSSLRELIKPRDFEDLVAEIEESGMRVVQVESEESVNGF